MVSRPGNTHTPVQQILTHIQKTLKHTDTSSNDALTSHTHTPAFFISSSREPLLDPTSQEGRTALCSTNEALTRVDARPITEEPLWRPVHCYIIYVRTLFKRFFSCAAYCAELEAHACSIAGHRSFLTCDLRINLLNFNLRTTTPAFDFHMSQLPPPLS